MSTPQENQQTVESRARKMAQALEHAGCFSYSSSMVDDDACGDCAGCIAIGVLEDDDPLLAALRDLVAQAELAKEIGERLPCEGSLMQPCNYPEAPLCRNCALLARLDGAR